MELSHALIFHMPKPATHLATWTAIKYNIWIMKQVPVVSPSYILTSNQKVVKFSETTCIIQLQLLPLLYLLSVWSTPYPFSNGIVAIWYPSLSGWWIQFITSSLVSPLVYLISLKNCPQGSSILFLTTSLKIAIKFLQFRGFPAKRPISTSDADCCFIRISLVPISCLLFSSINNFWSFVTWTSYLQP